MKRIFLISASAGFCWVSLLVAPCFAESTETNTMTMAEPHDATLPPPPDAPPELIEEDKSPKTGITIDVRPIVVVTMEAGHTYALWEKEDLKKEWAPVWPLTNMVVTGNDKRMILEKSINAPTGFWWLQIDGAPFPTNPVNTNAVSEPPPIPTQNE